MKSKLSRYLNVKSKTVQEHKDSFLYKLGVRKAFPTMITNPEASKKILKHWQTRLHKNRKNFFKAKKKKKEKGTKQIKNLEENIFNLYEKIL